MAAKRTSDLATSEIAAIANGTGRLFDHRRRSLVLGLTGRTGSGCSTVADEILTKNSFGDLSWPDMAQPSRDHEDRKDRIVEDWLRRHWKPFRKLQVSQLI